MSDSIVVEKKPTTFVIDKDGKQVDARLVAVPTNRNFRAAWVLNGAVMEVDMEVARALLKTRMVAAKENMMGSASNVEAFIEAQLSGNPTTVAAFAAKFQAIKDGISDAQIDAVATPEALSALWDANKSSLGDNPFNPGPATPLG